jgi:gamma-glutamylcyclotransferase (GGCT)/AIG2-like uncharacterized protein YtfP
MPILFVYGTLKQGHSNHRVMEAAAGEFLGPAQLPAEEFQMVNLGPFPGLVRVDQKDATVIHGECFLVDSLKRFDRLEGYPDFYGRCTVATTCGVRVVVYFLANPEQFDKSKTIPCGSWSHPSISCKPR